MGERIQYVASVIFALVFVALLSMMNSNVLQYGNAVNDKVNNNISMSETYELQSFDGTVVTGDTVISAIKNCNTLSNQKLMIEVHSSDGLSTTYGEGGAYSEYSASVGRNYYIGPTQQFTAVLDKNINDVITNISFTYLP